LLRGEKRRYTWGASQREEEKGTGSSTGVVGRSLSLSLLGEKKKPRRTLRLTPREKKDRLRGHSLTLRGGREKKTATFRERGEEDVLVEKGDSFLLLRNKKDTLGRGWTKEGKVSFRLRQRRKGTSGKLFAEQLRRN